MSRLGLVAAALALSSTVASAEPYVVNFSTTSKATGMTYSIGRFEGMDLDTDGLLEQNELTYFSSASMVRNDSWFLTDPSQLSGFGDYKIADNTWMANGLGHDGKAEAWFSWNNGLNAVDSSWSTIAGVNYQSSPSTLTPPASSYSTSSQVPEPASWTIASLALLAALLAGQRRKHN